MFAGSGINITTEGRKHLGAALGSRSYLEQYVGGKVEDWVGEVTRSAEFARSQPQATVSDKNSWDTLAKRCIFPFSGSPRPSQSCLSRFGHQILYTNIEGTRRPQRVPTILTETVFRGILGM